MWLRLALLRLSKGVDLFTDVSVSVHSACKICHVLPKSKTEEQMRKFTLPLLPLALFLVADRYERHSLLWQLATKSQFAGEQRREVGLREPAPWICKHPSIGDHLWLHRQGSACGDSVHDEFSHPGLQTLGTGLKNGISKQPQHCMNGSSVIIRN